MSAIQPLTRGTGNVIDQLYHQASVMEEKPIENTCQQ